MPLVWEWMHDIENLDLIGLYFLKQMMMMILFFFSKKKKRVRYGRMPHVLTVSVNFENFYCTTAFIGVKSKQK